MRLVSPALVRTGVLSLVVLIGCQGAEEAPVAPVPDPPPPTTGLRVDLLPSTIIAGVGLYTTASLQAPPYTRQEGAVTWSSSDATVLRITQGARGYVFVTALRPGTAVLSAVAGQLGVRMPVDVVARPTETLAAAETSLEITRFALVELGGEGEWGFLPEIEARSRDGNAVRILGFELDVPGVTGIPACWTSRVLGTTPRFLIQESYGEWELWFSSDQRYTSGPIKARIIAQEASGRVVMVEVTGAVTPGGWPETYSSAPPNPWNCGS